MNINLKAKVITTMFALSLLLVSSNVFAGNDPSIKGKLRADIQSSMDEYVKTNTIKGIYAHFDPVTGKLHSLKLDYLHSGIVKKGDFYVSCADFIDQETGKSIDMDFFVRDNFGKAVTVQAIVHKIDKKRKYQLEEIKVKK